MSFLEGTVSLASKSMFGQHEALVMCTAALVS